MRMTKGLRAWVGRGGLVVWWGCRVRRAPTSWCGPFMSPKRMQNGVDVEHGAKCHAQNEREDAEMMRVPMTDEQRTPAR
jgi:hypothetical protein